MKCKNCRRDGKQVKARKTQERSQMYKCRHCEKRYTPNPKERCYSDEVEIQVIRLYMEGNSGKAVGRILGISKNTCLYWIKKYAKKIEPKNTDNGRA